MSRCVVVLFALLFVVPTTVLSQIAPPAPGVEMPQAYYDRIAQDPKAFQFQKAWIQKAQRAKEARLEYFSQYPPPEELSLASLPDHLRRQMVVTGTVHVPVIVIDYTNRPAPFPAINLENKLFNGTNDMTDLYTEMSYGNVTLTGDVLGWVNGSNTDAYYEGGCAGLCGSAKTGQLILEALNGVDATTDFGQYDNDGPDGVPNSGDDDGFVDFIAVVHPETGGECGGGNMWSHRWVVAGWPEFASMPWTSNDPRTGGGNILVYDYTIQPARGSVNGCGTGINEIGVFAHEFGHAFGLPDLYDTDGGGQGIGEHGLMGSGNWNEPSNPAHMCVWSKDELGWLAPTVVGPVAQGYTLDPVETNAQGYQLNIVEEKFSRKTFQPLSGTASLHCGLPTGAAGARNWQGGSGYGNSWHERSQRKFSYDGSNPVTLQYDASYDSEPTYDFGRVIIDVGGVETVLASYDGNGSVTGATADLTPQLNGSGATEYTIIFEFESDFAWSDEDGDFLSGPNGPFKLDNVSVTGGGENYFTDFEQYEDGWYYDFNETPNKEFFLVEHRNKSGTFDQFLFSEGLMIWHIEQNVAHSALGNTNGTSGTANQTPGGVELRQADGANNLRLGVNRGDTGDAYPGSTSNTTFDNSTTPNSLSHNGFATNVAVENISGPGATMTATMRGGAFPPTVASITPDKGEREMVIQITEVAGTFINHGATFLLRILPASAGGEAAAAIDYPASNVEWVGKTKLTGEFDLTGVPSATYDLVVQNPDGQEAVLVGGFEVTDPVPVFIQDFGARVAGAAIELHWSLYADEDISGFRIYRRESGSTVDIAVNNGELIDPSARTFVDADIDPGKTYSYFLVVVLPNGSELRSRGVTARSTPYPLALDQNYPNPFNPSTRIRFSLPARGHVTLSIFDAKGRRITTLIDGERGEGINQETWNGTDANGVAVSSGVYFYRLKAGEKLLTRKMLLLK